MKLKVTGKELMITEALNDYVEKKLSRIEKYFEDLEADVTLRTEKNEQIAEMNIYFLNVNIVQSCCDRHIISHENNKTKKHS